MIDERRGKNKRGVAYHAESWMHQAVSSARMHQNRPIQKLPKNFKLKVFPRLCDWNKLNQTHELFARVQIHC
jgi:hypothetical protein